jgi:Tfp pilus assembly protein PilZ
VSLEKHHLTVEFSTEAAFRSEYLSNIANGGIFIATQDDLVVCTAVVVRLCLSYCDRTLELPGEVVHCVPAEMAETGALPGVAIQFSLPAKELRAEFEPIVGIVEGNERISRSGRRAAPRSPARIAVTLRASGYGERLLRTRDISSSGLLVTVTDEAIAIGEPVGISIVQPQSGEVMDVDGTIMRHLNTEDGVVTAMGVEFYVPEARQTEVSAFMNDVRAAEHTRRLGGISGPIAELGIENLLQMFGSSSPQGSLTLSRGCEEGIIAFKGGMLVAAKLGRCSQHDAIKQLLSWREGRFEFQACIDECELDADGASVSVTAAILEALGEIGESARAASSSGDLSARAPVAELDLDADLGLSVNRTDDADLEVEEIVLYEQVVSEQAETETSSLNILPHTTFEVDVAEADAMRAKLDKTEEAVLDLASVDFSVRRITEVIPESEPDIHAALESLIERGLIRSR